MEGRSKGEDLEMNQIPSENPYCGDCPCFVWKDGRACQLYSRALCRGEYPGQVFRLHICLKERRQVVSLPLLLAELRHHIWEGAIQWQTLEVAITKYFQERPQIITTGKEEEDGNKKT